MGVLFISELNGKPFNTYPQIERLGRYYAHWPLEIITVVGFKTFVVSPWERNSLETNYSHWGRKTFTTFMPFLLCLLFFVFLGVLWLLLKEDDGLSLFLYFNLGFPSWRTPHGWLWCPVQLYSHWMAFLTIRNKLNSFCWIALAALVQFGQTRSIYSRIVKKAIQYDIIIEQVINLNCTSVWL